MLQVQSRLYGALLRAAVLESEIVPRKSSRSCSQSGKSIDKYLLDQHSPVCCFWMGKRRSLRDIPYRMRFALCGLILNDEEGRYFETYGVDAPIQGSMR